MSKIEQQTFYVRDKPDTKCHPDTSCAKHNKTWMKLKLLKQTKNSLSKQQFKFLTIQIDFEWHRCLSFKIISTKKVKICNLTSLYIFLSESLSYSNCLSDKILIFTKFSLWDWFRLNWKMRVGGVFIKCIDKYVNEKHSDFLSCYHSSTLKIKWSYIPSKYFRNMLMSDSLRLKS